MGIQILGFQPLARTKGPVELHRGNSSEMDIYLSIAFGLSIKCYFLTYFSTCSHSSLKRTCGGRGLPAKMESFIILAIGTTSGLPAAQGHPTVTVGAGGCAVSAVQSEHILLRGTGGGVGEDWIAVPTWWLYRPAV